MDHSESIRCQLCTNSKSDVQNTLIVCSECQFWFHSVCVGLCEAEVRLRGESRSPWICPSCTLKDGTLSNCDSVQNFISCPRYTGKNYKGIKGLKIHWARAHHGEPLEGVSSSLEDHRLIFYNQLYQIVKSTFGFCVVSLRALDFLLQTSYLY